MPITEWDDGDLSLACDDCGRAGGAYRDRHGQPTRPEDVGWFSADISEWLDEILPEVLKNKGTDFWLKDWEKIEFREWSEEEESREWDSVVFCPTCREKISC